MRSALKTVKYRGRIEALAVVYAEFLEFTGHKGAIPITVNEGRIGVAQQCQELPFSGQPRPSWGCLGRNDDHERRQMEFVDTTHFCFQARELSKVSTYSRFSIANRRRMVPS
jgi:hypothetical protein